MIHASTLDSSFARSPHRFARVYGRVIRAIDDTSPDFAGAASRSGWLSVVWFMYRTGAERRYSTAEIVASERVTSLFIDYHLWRSSHLATWAQRRIPSACSCICSRARSNATWQTLRFAGWQGIRLDHNRIADAAGYSDVLLIRYRYNARSGRSCMF